MTPALWVPGALVVAAILFCAAALLSGQPLVFLPVFSQISPGLLPV